MAKLTVFLYRLGATAANIAQSVLQTSGGGNGDPQALDETAKRERDPESTSDSGSETDPS